MSAASCLFMSLKTSHQLDDILPQRGNRLEKSRDVPGARRSGQLLCCPPRSQLSGGDLGSSAACELPSRQEGHRWRLLLQADSWSLQLRPPGTALRRRPALQGQWPWGDMCAGHRICLMFSLSTRRKGWRKETLRRRTHIRRT